MNVFEASVVLNLIDHASSALGKVAMSMQRTQAAADALNARLAKIGSVYQSAILQFAGSAALAAPLVYATKSAMHLESALARVKIQTGASNDQMKVLNETLTKTANATGIFSKPTLARFASEMYSSGIRDMGQINALLPGFAKAADVLQLMSGGKQGATDTLHGLVAMAHQFGKYDPKSMAPIAEAAVAMSLSLPGGLKSLASTGASLNVPGNRMLGIDPVQLLAFQAAVAQTSGSTGSGGRGRMSASNQINALMRALPGILGSGLISGKSGFSAATMGLADSSGASTLMKNGKLDFNAYQSKLAAFEKLSSYEIAQRMNANIGMLSPKKVGDIQPIVSKALSTHGAGVDKKQLIAMLMQWQFGSAGTVATLMGDEKFINVQNKMMGAARKAQKEGGIERMQAQVMMTLEAQLKRMHTNMETLASTIGTHMIPVLTPLITKFNDFLDVANAFAEKNPKIIQAGIAILATASALLLLGGAFNILRAGFMGLQLIFGPLKLLLPGITAAIRFLIGGGLVPLTNMFGGVRVVAFGLLRVLGPLGLAITAVSLVVMNWDKIMAFVNKNQKFFIHVAAEAARASDALGAALAGLVRWLGACIAAIGGMVGNIGAMIGKIPALGAFGSGIQNTGNALGHLAQTSLDRVLKVDDVTAKRDEKYLQGKGYGALVSGIKGGKQPVVNQTNHITIQQVPGHDHKKCAATASHKLFSDVLFHHNASSGNSVGRSNMQGGATRP